MGSGFSKHTDDMRAEPPAPDVTTSTTSSTSSSTSTTDPDSGGGGCPMKRNDGSYSFDWKAMLRPEFPHRQGVVAGKEPATNDSSQSTQSSQHPQYNVYSQPLDPSNNMPPVANQLPAPSQQKALSTERVSSSIPKVNEHESER